VLGFDTTDATGDATRVYALEESPFQFTGFAPSTTTLSPGEQFTAEVTVENVDDEVRPYNLSLMADAPLPVDWWSLDYANGTLNPGESRTLTFAGSLNISGTWNLSVKRSLGRGAAIGPKAVEVVHATPSDEWSQTEYDGGRTKFNPDTAGPTQHIQEVWNLTGFDGNNEPVIANGSVFVLLEGYESPSVYRLAAYDEATGVKEWEFNISARDRIPSGSPTVHDGTVYLFTHPYNYDSAGPKVVDNSLFALDASDGSTVWSRDFTLNESVSRDQAPVVSDGQVYVAGGIPEDNSYDANASLIAFDADTGVTSWSYSVSADGENELFEWVTASDGMVVASLSDEDYDGSTTTYHDRLVVLNAAGGVEWLSSGLSPDVSDPPVVRDGTVYVVNETKNDAGDGAETLFALNLSDGTQKWEFVPYDLHPDVDDWRLYSPVVTDDAVYLRQMMMDTSPRRNELYRLDPATGNVVWNRSIPRFLDFMVVDGLVYAGDTVGGYNDGDDTLVYDAETGEFYGGTTVYSRAHGSVKAVANGTMILYADSTTPNDFRVVREGGVIEYTDIAVDSHVVGEDENVTVTVTATNVGSYARAYDVKLWASPDDSGAHHFWNYADRDGTLAPG
ncbi:PQQ-binding-like beta-propeller repeat protein, partial [Haloferax profundi]|uniref:PQQ-binding-like beta-propeller repeat protein n=1 Tax=Haloferax profundi TaxID=1544718 RepID=UPI000AFFD116